MNKVYGRAILLTGLSIVILSVLSWLGSVYGWGLRNLLCTDGIRWAVSSMVTNFTKSPLAETILLLLGCGVVIESGIIRSFSKASRSSLKRRRALILTGVVFALFVVAVSLLTFIPHAVLLSAFGTIGESPFAQGLLGLFFMGCMITGCSYGLFSGRFASLRDVLKAQMLLLVNSSSHFVLMLFVAELLACVDYTGLANVYDNGLLLFVAYYVPLAVYVIAVYRRKG